MRNPFPAVPDPPGAAATGLDHHNPCSVQHVR